MKTVSGQSVCEYTIAIGDIIRSSLFVFGMKPRDFETRIGEVEIAVGFDRAVRLVFYQRPIQV